MQAGALVFASIVGVTHVVVAQGEPLQPDEQPAATAPTPDPITLEETLDAPESTAEPAAEPAAEPDLEARAEPQPDPQPIDAPPLARGARTHDGFYLRFGLGYGTMSAKNSGAGTYNDGSGGSFTEPAATVKTASAAFDFFLGATPFDGLVVGGCFLLNTGPNPTVEVSGTSYESAGSANFFFLGPFVDVFPDPNAGFHLGALAGYADLQLIDNNDSDVDQSPPPWRAARCPKNSSFSRPEKCGRLYTEGTGYGVFAGYDAFIHRQWSVGGYARALLFSGEQNSGSTSGWAIALMATALYH